MARLFQVARMARPAIPAWMALVARRLRRAGVALAFALAMALGAALLLSPCVAHAADSPPKKKQEPAKISISGYGFLGNRELKRILRTIELSGKKPERFDPGFVEDAALILTARIKRDGYLAPTLQIRLRLESGKTIEVRAADLLDNPLPRPMPITRAQFIVHKGVLYHYQTLRFEGLETVTEKEARNYFEESETLFVLKTARVYTPERLRHGLSSLSDVLDRQGYKDATVTSDMVRSDERTGAVSVHVKVVQGKKYIVRSVREEFFYGAATEPDSTRTVHPNKPYSRLWQQDFSLSLKTNQFKLGYPDTAVELSTIGQQERDRQVEMDLAAAVKSGRQ